MGKIHINTFNTDIDPSGDSIDASPGHASIDVSSGSGFRKPGPGSTVDSGYVGSVQIYHNLLL